MRRKTIATLKEKTNVWLMTMTQMCWRSSSYMHKRYFDFESSFRLERGKKGVLQQSTLMKTNTKKKFSNNLRISVGLSFLIKFHRMLIDWYSLSILSVALTMMFTAELAQLRQNLCSPQVILCTDYSPKFCVSAKGFLRGRRRFFQFTLFKLAKPKRHRKWTSFPMNPCMNSASATCTVINFSFLKLLTTRPFVAKLIWKGFPFLGG